MALAAPVPIWIGSKRTSPLNVSVGFIHLASGLKLVSVIRELGIIAGLGLASKKKVSPYWMTIHGSSGIHASGCFLVVHRKLLLERRLRSLLYSISTLTYCVKN
jgi:hypothetical protein